MRLMRDKWPASNWAKVDAALQWALLGFLLGCLCYPLMWQLMEPTGQPPGAAVGVILLLTSPWGWGFLALFALSMALIPLMAVWRSTEATYGSLLLCLVRSWSVGLVITAAAAVFAYRRNWLAHGMWSAGPLTLAIPTLLLLLVVILGCRSKRAA